MMKYKVEYKPDVIGFDGVPIRGTDYITISTEGGISTSVSAIRSYHTMKAEIASSLAHLAMQLLIHKIIAKTGKRPPSKAIKPLPAKGFMKAASAILREAREQGFECPVLRHSLNRRRGYGLSEPPEHFMEMWRKDHVFRAACLHTRDRNWDVVLEHALHREKQVINDLIKPLRRLLATRKISFLVASRLASMSKEAQQAALNAPRWKIASAKTLDNLGNLNLCARMIRQYGRTPARDVANPRRSEVGLVNSEWWVAIRSLGSAGGVVPTSQAGIRKLVRDLHNPKSLAYKMVNREREADIYLVSAPLPNLPDIGDTEVRLFSEAEDWRREGREMGHCVGMYLGSEALFAGVRRGDERVTLMVAPGGAFQCYGMHNRVNQLSTDITAQWVPILKEWVTPDKFTLKRHIPDNPEGVAVYD